MISHFRRTRRGSKRFSLERLARNLDVFFVFSSVLISSWGKPYAAGKRKWEGGTGLRPPPPNPGDPPLPHLTCTSHHLSDLKESILCGTYRMVVTRRAPPLPIACPDLGRQPKPSRPITGPELSAMDLLQISSLRAAARLFRLSWRRVP